MKKIVVAAFAVLSLVAAGCNPQADACVKMQTCLEADDPSAECKESYDDCQDDEDCKKISDACKAEMDAQASCFSANMKCEDKMPSLDPEDACDKESEAALDCQIEAAKE